jgi:hypothetical protein
MTALTEYTCTVISNYQLHLIFMQAGGPAG